MTKRFLLAFLFSFGISAAVAQTYPAPQFGALGIGVAAPGAGSLNITGTYEIGGSPLSAANLSNGVTGSGNAVLATSPTIANADLTGTVTYPSATANYVLAAPNGSSGALVPRLLVGADLPNPGASSKGGVESIAATSHEWVNTISTSGVPALSQPATTDLSDIGTFSLSTSGTLTTSNTTASTSTTTGAIKDAGGMGVGGAAYLSSLGLTASSGAITATANSPLNGVYVSSDGAQVTWCPAFNFGCPSPAGGSAFTGQIASVTTTYGAANVQESAFIGVLYNDTGQDRLWAISTAFTSGSYAEANSNLYLETVTSCTSASTGTGPSGTGTGITDNTCSWNFAGPSYAVGKNEANFNIVDEAGGAKSWNITGGTKLDSGWNSHFATDVEQDILNYSGIDPAPGSGTTIDYIYLGGGGTDPATYGLNISPQPVSGFGVHTAIFINGANAVKDNNIWFDTTGGNAGIYDQGSYVSAAYSNAATAPIGVDLAGSYSTAGLYVNNAGAGWAIQTAAGSAGNVDIQGVLALTNPIDFAGSSTGSTVQTFTNSPCSGASTERWIPASISGQTGTWYVPACQ